MATVHNTRHTKLLLLIQQAGTIQALADRLGKSHSQISQLRNQVVHSSTGRPRVIGDDLAREIEKKLDLPEGWMDSDQFKQLVEAPESAGVAHDLSQARPTLSLSKVTWEELRMGLTPNQPFELDVMDDALAPEIFTGCVAMLDPKRPPEPAWPVLVRDKRGDVYLRDYEAGPGDSWRAVSRARGFRSLDSIEDGLTIIAAMDGYRRPRRA